MKHIKRKFRNEFKSDAKEFEEKYNVIDLNGNREEFRSIKHAKGLVCFLHTDSDMAVEAFQVRIDGKYYYIPEPDLILIYFDSAQRHYKSIAQQKKEIIKAFDIETSDMKLDVHKLYTHYELCVVFVTSLFTSIEAFMNKIIPDDYLFSDPKSNRVEVYNKEQIQRFISFDTKIKRILKEITNKDFQKAHPNKYQFIENLKNFRDSIIHTKTSNEGNTPYEHLFKLAFTFRYEEVLHAVRDFINFYENDYVVECDCGGDF
ncbi:hypothetical protein GCM10028806_28060 [Spirosoma terrae]|uniref:RiboL-PSP-HEPN domain-containing protein n=1 Tax=Spirosoma terrae TaxID=1968276 RepID=A0A6L9L9U4_9BACT|nr:hypothetical protein [Spirosoma terrae]NDU97230.1 hypothetical protein [Spirosoma terrae]